jgi:hypothetical protein
MKGQPLQKKLKSPIEILNKKVNKMIKRKSPLKKLNIPTVNLIKKNNKLIGRSHLKLKKNKKMFKDIKNVKNIFFDVLYFRYLNNLKLSNNYSA